MINVTPMFSGDTGRTGGGGITSNQPTSLAHSQIRTDKNGKEFSQFTRSIQVKNEQNSSKTYKVL